MKQTLKVLQDSAKELNNIYAITVTGMLIAISIVISLFTIVISNFMHISFSCLPLAECSMLYGPVVGGIMGILSDIFGYFAHPNGAFFPGFTASALLSGIIYGFFLYKKSLTFIRVVILLLIKTIFVNLLLNSLWLSIMYGQAFTLLFACRIISEVVIFPIDAVLLFVTLKFFGRINLGKKKYSDLIE